MKLAACACALVSVVALALTPLAFRLGLLAGAALTLAACTAMIGTTARRMLHARLRGQASRLLSDLRDLQP